LTPDASGIRLLGERPFRGKGVDKTAGKSVETKRSIIDSGQIYGPNTYGVPVVHSPNIRIDKQLIDHGQDQLRMPTRCELETIQDLTLHKERGRTSLCGRIDGE
jgi:hypothetical protein